MLRNYEMKDKYGIFCIINSAFHKFTSSRARYLLLFGTEVVVQGQTIHFVPNENNYNYMFHSGRKGFNDRNISFSYDTICFVFGSRKFYETICFVFHFIITQLYM